MLINSTAASNINRTPQSETRLLYSLTSPVALRPIETKNKYFLLNLSFSLRGWSWIKKRRNLIFSWALIQSQNYWDILRHHKNLYRVKLAVCRIFCCASRASDVVQAFFSTKKIKFLKFPKFHKEKAFSQLIIMRFKREKVFIKCYAITIASLHELWIILTANFDENGSRLADDSHLD